MRTSQGLDRRERYYNGAMIHDGLPGGASHRLEGSDRSSILGHSGATFTLANEFNDSGQVVGFGNNTIPRCLCSVPVFVCPERPGRFCGRRSLARLGLGGPDAAAYVVNERGQIGGGSSTSSTPNPATGLPTLDPFLWENGSMVDLGSLGGTSGVANALNNRGQVVGESNLAGDVSTHPFLWTKPGPMRDLGTFGGTFGYAIWINEAGEILGQANYPGDVVYRAFLWRNGVMTDLGTATGFDCSFPSTINSSGQVVGGSIPCAGGPSHATLWENGSIIDLNSFVPLGSGLQLPAAVWINDRGEIVVNTLLPNGNFRNAVLIPCEGDANGCQGENQVGESPVGLALVTQPRTIATPANPVLSGRGMLDRLRARRFPGRRSVGPASGPTR